MGTNGPKTVAFHTLGCKLNYAESAALADSLVAEGFTERRFDEAADVYVLNTCSVTEAADKECRHLVRRIRRLAPGAAVVVTGCYAQLKPADIAAIPGVDLVLGAAEKFNLSAHLRTLTAGDSSRIASCDIEDVSAFHGADSGGHRTRAFLKVQDGCDYGCAFCTIPKARGRSRSDSVAGVVQRAEALAQKGVKEIVLTGVNLGDFGAVAQSGRNREASLLHLIRALDEVEGIERFRLSSVEPNLLSDAIIEAVAKSRRFMPHFHLPLQSGSDRILGLMRRRYRRSLYAGRIAAVKAAMPHAGIGADVIVGFPTESNPDFRETVDFLESLPLSYLHVFTYSERDDTAALDLRPIVPISERHTRNKVLRAVSFEKSKAFAEAHGGQIRPVLWERGEKAALMEGYTDNYIRVQAMRQEGWANTVQPWTL